MKQPKILLKDYNDIWCPLGDLYYTVTSSSSSSSGSSSSSSSGSSSSSSYSSDSSSSSAIMGGGVIISKHPKSTFHEIVSLYCPQCLTRYSEDEAHTYFGCCPSCHQCPCCEAVLSSAYDSKLYCGMCLWQYQKSSDESNSNLSLMDTALSMNDGSASSAHASSSLFSSILNQLKLEEQRNGSNSRIHLMRGNNLQAGLDRRKDRLHNVWQLSDLERKLSQTVISGSIFDQPTPSMMSTTSIDLDHGPSVAVSTGQVIMSCMDDMSLTTLRQRERTLRLNDVHMQASGTTPTRVKLRTKRTIRSRHDVGKGGRMLILVQPKTLPLEGDSSLKVHKGKWWVKDSSAIHELPFASILSLPSCMDVKAGKVCQIVVRFTNYKEQPVIMKFDGVKQSTNIQQRPFTMLDPLDKSSSISVTHTLLLVDCLSRISNKCSVSGDLAYSRCDETSRVVLIRLDAHEDELLRDDDPSPSASDNSQASSTVDGRDDLLWSYTTSHNTATVTIPIRLSGAPTMNEIGDLHSEVDYELQLCCEVDLGSGLFIDLPLKIIF